VHEKAVAGFYGCERRTPLAAIKTEITQQRLRAPAVSEAVLPLPFD
jgi:hypothetical protein